MHYVCQQPDQIVGRASEELPADDASGSAAAESGDGADDDVWSREVPSSEDVDKASVAADHIKRLSLELPEDLLHIKPYVNRMCKLSLCFSPVLTVFVKFVSGA